MKHFALLFALTLVLAGCRDYVVDAGPPQPATPPSAPAPSGQPAPTPEEPPIPGIATLALKGPAVVQAGEPALFRIQVMSTAHSYRFTVEDRTVLLAEDSNDTDRFLNTLGMIPGETEIVGYALNADGAVIARKSRVIVVE